jgi:hypothetical protein
VTVLQVDYSGFESQLRQETYFFSKKYRSVLGPSSPILNGYQDSFLGAQQPGITSDISPQNSTHVKNKWHYTPITLYAFMAWIGANLTTTEDPICDHLVMARSQNELQ